MFLYLPNNIYMYHNLEPNNGAIPTKSQCTEQNFTDFVVVDKILEIHQTPVTLTK